MRGWITAALAALLICGTAAADVLQEISDRGTVRLGVRPDAPPFSYTGPDGMPQGLAVALCREVTRRIAGQLGVAQLGTEYVRVDARERFPALMEGRTDIHCGPASATLRRREILDFSVLYFVDGAAAAVRPGTYESVFDNRAGKFGVLAGTTTEAVVQDLIQRNDITAEVIQFPSHGVGLDALADGDVDLYFGDQAILLFQIDSKGLSDELAVMEDIFSFEPYALVVKRGENDLRLAVDRALSEIYEEGLIYALILAELGDYALSPEARAVYQIVGLPK